MNSSPNVIVTLTGPSTAGKTVLSELLEAEGFAALVSTTTRPIRKGEKDGESYHFLTPERFKEKLANGEFIEHVEYDNNSYGICSDEAKRAFEKGKPAILVAEPNGSEQIHAFCQNHGWTSLRVFVNNPIPVLLDRLLKRFAYDADAEVSNGDVKLALDAFVAEMGDGGEDLESVAVRHLRKFAQDIGVSTDPEKLAKLISTHGRRISKILGQEQEEWVKPAYASNSPYDLVIDEFNADNTEQVVSKVLDLLHPPALREGLRRSRPRA